jgi:hypothetical protein
LSEFYRPLLTLKIEQYVTGSFGWPLELNAMRHDSIFDDIPSFAEAVKRKRRTLLGYGREEQTSIGQAAWPKRASAAAG